MGVVEIKAVLLCLTCHVVRAVCGADLYWVSSPFIASFWQLMKANQISFFLFWIVWNHTSWSIDVLNLAFRKRREKQLWIITFLVFILLCYMFRLINRMLFVVFIMWCERTHPICFDVCMRKFTVIGGLYRVGTDMHSASSVHGCSSSRGKF